MTPAESFRAVCEKEHSSFDLFNALSELVTVAKEFMSHGEFRNAMRSSWPETLKPDPLVAEEGCDLKSEVNPAREALVDWAAHEKPDSDTVIKIVARLDELNKELKEKS